MNLAPSWLVSVLCAIVAFLNSYDVEALLVASRHRNGAGLSVATNIGRKSSVASSSSTAVQVWMDSDNVFSRAELRTHDGIRKRAAMWLKAGSQESLQAVMHHMSLMQAVERFSRRKYVPRALRSVLQKMRRSHGRHRKKHKASTKNVAKGKQAVAKGKQAVNTKDVAHAKLILNNMFEDAERKLDLEQVKCSEFEERQLELLEMGRQDISKYNALAAQARAKILRAQSLISTVEKEMPQATDALDQHKKTCLSTSLNLKEQLKIAVTDSGVMDQINSAIDCNSDSGSTTLLQCPQDGAHGSIMTFGHGDMRQTLTRLQSKYAQGAVQQSLAQLFSQTKTVAASVMLVEEDATTHRISQIPGAPEVLNPQSVSNTSDTPLPNSRECTMKDSPNCQVILDKMLNIQTGIMDKADELRKEINRVQTECGTEQLNLEAQLADLENRDKEGQTLLSEGSKMNTENGEQSRLKNEEIKEMQKDYTTTMRECKVNIENFQGDMCGVKKLRGEVLKLAQESVFVSDCEVTEWSQQECSVTCGGGTQLMTRSPLAFPVGGGAECPPLKMKRNCNQQQCPTDCQVSDYSRWSSCTAKCGGGTQQRSKTVLVQPQHGGQECGQTDEERVCNGQACDKACSLSDWSDWSTCSKMCQTGRNSRRRDIDTPAQGDGHCPEVDSERRLEYRKCNTGECRLPPNRTTIECDSKLDVILVLDGSASLRAAGWNATKNAAAMLVNAFHGGADGVKLGVILYSGPKSFSAFKTCTEGGVADLERDCGIQWISHFTDDIQSIANKIPNMVWPEATTFTATALMTALSELQFGRRDASSVVIVLTDGKPMSPKKTGEAADRLRERARLMWVPITANAPLRSIKKWASKPVAENVLRVRDFEDLEKPETITSIIADACPKVILGEKPLSQVPDFD